MSTLLHLLKEANVPLSVFCEKLDLTEDHALEMAHTADDETQMEAYWRFITILNDENLLPELLNFYTPFASDTEEIAALIKRALRLINNNIPRRMLNSVHRLITLADAMEQVRPGKDSLKIFHFVVCIETLFHLRDGDVANKTQAVIDFFENYMDANDKLNILGNFRRSLGDERYRLTRLHYESETEHSQRTQNPHWLSTEISIETFARIINEIRNCFAHEGDYWNFNFAKSDMSMMNALTIAETRSESSLKRRGITQGLRRVYEVDLTYELFKGACIRTFLEFTRTYMKEINA